MPNEGGGLPTVKSLSQSQHGIDPNVPHVARMYDYFLDGARNFAVDREIADKIEKAVPSGRDAARINRAFLRRSVQFMVDSGIRQFLDIGSGVPSAGTVHEIAQRAEPECRTVYVDKEPVMHSEALRGNDRVTAIQANLRDVEDVFNHPQTRCLLDFDQPIGLLMLWVLHFIPDPWDPVSIMARYRDRLAPASYLAITHITADGNTPGLDEVFRLYRSTPNPAYPRSHSEVLGLFAGFELVEPGLVGSAYWRPTGPGDVSSDAAMNTVSYGGVGRKP